MPTVCYQILCILYQKLEILSLHIIFEFNKSNICKLYSDSQVCRDKVWVQFVANF